MINPVANDTLLESCGHAWRTGSVGRRKRRVKQVEQSSYIVWRVHRHTFDSPVHRRSNTRRHVAVSAEKQVALATTVAEANGARGP